MMEICLQLLLLAAGFIMLIKGADLFVDGAAGISQKLRIPQLIIGLTVVAMGTSLPEAAVSISSALKGNADITVGNVVGSNILNILIILGLSAAITPLTVGKSTVRYELPFLAGISALLLLQGLDGNISLTDGIIQLIFFAAYLAYLLFSAKKHPAENSECKKTRNIWMSILFTVAGIAIIITGSVIAVDAASKIARAVGMSERFIGLTVVALGTSLPELFTSVSAARKGNADIAIGNIVGSNIFNILFVIGISSAITPVPFAENFRFDCVVSIIVTILLFAFSVKKHRINRINGIIMLILYAAYFLLII